eukprot:TRINITY_DN10583_c0_g1_i1.p2 TRINITY_DN10583_c0_g1~~TRINITY_DN10583_c0_g1_i1.p2  ORF type:complete len:226 (+),score=20.83 TRINITY_DN10583_c0_g1_i1:936-1613(+)
MSVFFVFVVVPTLTPFVFVGIYKAKTYEARQQLRITLQEYDVRKSKCFCCQSGHVLPDGSSIPCDRVFVEESIQAWYGGLDDFNGVVRTELNEETATILGKETVSSLPLLIIISSFNVWAMLGQGLINPWNSYRFKVGTILELFFIPSSFVLADAVTGRIMKKLWQLNIRGSWLRCWVGLLFFSMLCIIGDSDIVFLNENVPLWMAVSVALSTIGLGLAARHFAP